MGERVSERVSECGDEMMIQSSDSGDRGDGDSRHGFTLLSLSLSLWL